MSHHHDLCYHCGQNHLTIEAEQACERNYTQCSQCKEYTLTTEPSCAHCERRHKETTMHTPTPWIHVSGSLIRDTHGTIIAGDTHAFRSEDNAKFIVQAVNSHAALVEALEGLTNNVIGMLGMKGDELRGVLSNTNVAVLMHWVSEAKQVLAKEGS